MAGGWGGVVDHGDVQNSGPVAGDRGFQGRQEFVGGGYPDAFSTVSRGDFGIAWAVFGSVGRTWERCPIGQAVMRFLQAGNGAEGVVIHDDPDNAEVAFDGGGQHRRVLAEAAVSDQGHHDTVRCSKLGADGTRRTKTHGGEAAWRQNRARAKDIKLLTDAVLVPADIGGDDGILRQRRAGIGENAFRHHREF